MPRSLSANALTKIAARFGNEPVSIVGVFWNGTQEILYADKDTHGIPGRILAMGEIDEVIKVEGSNSNASVNVTLDDTLGDIKTIYNVNDIHKKKVVVYQYFEGMDLNDKFIVMVGQINTPVVWDEADRKITFNVLSKIEENQTGFAPEEGQFKNVNSKFVGHAWPLAFGDVMHIPAVQVTEQPLGVTQTLIGVPDYTLVYKYWHLVDRLNILQKGYSYYRSAIEYLNSISRSPLEIIWNYIDIILEEDPLKQRHEDLTSFIVENDKVVEKLKQLLNEDSSEATVKPATLRSAPGYSGHEGPVVSTLSAEEQFLQDEQAVQDKIDQLTTYLIEYKLEAEDATRDLEALKGWKELFEIEAHNAEYAYKNINAIAKKIEKLLIDFVKTSHEVTKVVTVMEEQKSLPQNKVTVINGDRFPQNQQVRVTIGGMTYAGTFVGREFTTTGYEPRYENLKVAAKEDDQIDAFWLEDDSVNIKGHYCVTHVPLKVGDPEYILAQSGVVVSNPVTKVFKVTDQIGRKCIIELVELAPSIRLKKQTPNLPVLDDLPNVIWHALRFAQEHTVQEQERILEGAIEKFDKQELERIKSTLSKLRDVALEATYDDEIAAVNDTIYKNVHEYNDRVTRLRFTKETIDKVYELISEHEFSVLLKLCNLHLRLIDQDLFNEVEVPNVKVYYLTGPEITLVNATSLIMLPQWFEFSPGGQELTNNRTVINLPGGGKVVADFLPESTLWVAEPGSEVALVSDTTEIYVANIIPSTIKAVYGWKAVNGVRQLVPIPKSYYTKNEADNSFLPLSCTTITLKKPLRGYVGEDWETGVYVSLTSSVGPNTADIISWLLTTYTNVTPDAGTFAAVATKLTKFPSNFCLFDKRETLQLVQEIAWQARCAAFVKDSVAYLIYMSETPTPVATITESDVEHGSFSIEYTNTDNIVTKFVAKWRPDYAQKNNEDNRIVLRYNLPKYGEVEQDYDFYIYNIEDLVYKSATFWMIRNANTWKRVKFKTPLNRLNIETMDAVTLNFTAGTLANSSVVAVVEKASYDSDSNSVNFECWTPVRAGEMVPYDFAWPSGLAVDKLYPTVDEINAGYAGSPHSNVPKNIAYKILPNVNLVDQLVLRPKDYGEAFPSDAHFTLPNSPLLGLSEQDYLRINPSGYALPSQPRYTEENKQPGYESPVNSGTTSDASKTVFMGRITDVLDQLMGKYEVTDSTGMKYTVHQYSNQGDLIVGQSVTVVKEQNKFVTNDTTGSGIIVNYIAEITATSGAGQQTSYIVDVYEGQDKTAFDTVKEKNVEVFQSGSPLKYYFNGEVVVVRRINGVWSIQKLIESKYRDNFPAGDLGMRLSGYSNENNLTGIPISTKLTYSDGSAGGNSFLIDKAVDYKTILDYLDKHTDQLGSLVLAKGQTNAIFGRVSFSTTVPVRATVESEDVLKIYDDYVTGIGFAARTLAIMNDVTFRYSQDKPLVLDFGTAVTGLSGGSGGTGSVTTSGLREVNGPDPYTAYTQGGISRTLISSTPGADSGTLSFRSVATAVSEITNDKVVLANRVFNVTVTGSIAKAVSANYNNAILTSPTTLSESVNVTINPSLTPSHPNAVLNNDLLFVYDADVQTTNGVWPTSNIELTLEGGGLK